MSDRESDRKLRGSSRRSRGVSRTDDHNTRTRHGSRSHRDPRSSWTRPSRSRSRDDHRASRTRQNRSRSRHLSRSVSRTERELTRKREEVRTLENEVRRKRARINDDERDARSSTSMLSAEGRKDESARQNRHHRDRCLRTPTKEHDFVNHIDYKERSERRSTSNLFEEFLKVLKAKTGHNDSFSGSSLNNVIPEYDPMLKEQTINIWLDKVDECSDIYNWNERQTIHYALPKLTGLAKTWYQGLPTIKHTWNEWKEMLRESFPATENYAELLTDMLNRRVRPGESLEVYYFAKLNLLNRCKIFGKQAVDCLLYAIDDRGVRVGAQAARFDKPEDVLEFFKTVKSNRNQADTFKDTNRDRRVGTYTNFNNNPARSADTSSGTPKNNSNKGPIKCFNCQGVGHPSFKCPKPVVKCTNCGFLGYEASHCSKTKENLPPKDNSKNVLEVSVSENTNDKYKILISLNGFPITCQVDLGSEATLVRKKKKKKKKSCLFQ
ncbi:uncharacterized protein [Choristoneura fumiferana]|uniref:uncharacterized protein n=1 Tax=Choristoneura fumiferana TaxID=7141 RepID=UPI003D15CC2E